MIITGTLITFVVGGGVFIFWPDLKSKITSPKQKKQMSNRKREITELYDEHFSQEQLFIEAVMLYDNKQTDTLAEARGLLVQRGQLFKTFLASTEGNHYDCPVCSQHVRLHHGEVNVACTCKPFNSHAKQMAKKAGYELW